MMNLVAALGSIGTHLAGWRHPKAWTNTVINWEQHVECAQLAERGKFDLVFLADGNSVRDMDDTALFSAMAPASRPAGFEPLTLLASLAAVTNKIGFVATSTTSFDEPYSVARRFASLDHITNGRAAWNVVTSSAETDALNFSHEKHIPKDERYNRAREFVEITFALWDSWAEDAFPQDQQSGKYLSPDRVQTLNHKGKHFQVQGPLNVARAPQGRPVIFHAGQSEGGRDLAAFGADCIFAMTPTKEAARKQRDDMIKRAEAYGRERDSIKFLPGITVYMGRDRDEGEELYQTLNGLILPALGISHLSKLIGADLSMYSADDRMPLFSDDALGASAPRRIVNQMVRDEAPTIRQVYQRFLPTFGHPVFKGGPKDIADMMEDWYTSGVCDGFLFMPAVMPMVMESFVNLVIPELQRRGLFRKEYEGKTLRDIMGLPTPTRQIYKVD